MDSQLMTFSLTCSHPKRKTDPSTKPSFGIHQKTTIIAINSRSTRCHACYLHHKHHHRHQQKNKKKKPLPTRELVVSLREENVEKRGTVFGAVALIVGTSIGSGILALPQKALPAGLFPSSMSLLVCWAFLLVEALVLVEINVGLRRRKGIEFEETTDLDVISIRTMAQETLGDFGGALVTVTYVFLGYTSIIAYSSKSGEILFRLVNLPAPISGFVFTSLFTALISFGGTRKTDQVNQFLTAAMIVLLVAIEALAIVFGGWSGLVGIEGDWGKVPASLPVIIFSLVYHDIVPVLCAYLGNDLERIRISIFLGSLVPLATLLAWDAIAFGLSANTDKISDPVELLMSVEWSGVAYMVEAFSLLAIGTSLIGTILAFTEFFKEQIAKKNPFNSIASAPSQREIRENLLLGLTATAVAVAPPLLVSSTVPDAFSAATDFAGGYCMTMLYGILPPAMAWAMQSRQREDSEKNGLSNARPVLVGVGLFACGVVAEQILLDILILQP